MELRKVFDAIPDEFDRFRPHYCPELFADMIAYAGIGPDARVLEIGPGTGQATDPILDTGCDYHAIELGGHLCEKMRSKYGSRANFHLVHDDFITHDFGAARFDCVYSAATIQWIPEEIAFPKTFALLKPGGTLAMMLTSSEYRSANEDLYQAIQEVYSAHFHPETEYAQKFTYANAPDWGYVGFEKREYPSERVLTADEYVRYSATHCTHIILKEPERSVFFDGLRKAVLDAGDRIVFRDTYVLYLAKKPAQGRP